MALDPPATRLWIPAYGRTWLNANDRMLWMVKARWVKQWRTTAHVRAMADHVPHYERARIIGELRFADSRRRDPANWAPTAKACIDGLVDAGVLDDDDHTRVLGPDMRIGPKVKLPANVGLWLVIEPWDGRAV